MSLGIRAERPADASAVREVLERAFAGEPEVIALEETLRTRADSVGFVAEVDGRVVGQVRLTRGWIDAEPRLVEVLVLSPLSVLPDYQRRGIGRALAAHAVEQAEAMGAPAVFLEGSPTFYSRLGWRPASELRVTPPSARIPLAAFQVVPLSRWAGLDARRARLCRAILGTRLRRASRRACRHGPRVIAGGLIP